MHGLKLLCPVVRNPCPSVQLVRSFWESFGAKEREWSGHLTASSTGWILYHATRFLSTAFGVRFTFLKFRIVVFFRLFCLLSSLPVSFSIESDFAVGTSDASSCNSTWPVSYASNNTSPSFLFVNCLSFILEHRKDSNPSSKWQVSHVYTQLKQHKCWQAPEA